MPSSLAVSVSKAIRYHQTILTHGKAKGLIFARYPTSNCILCLFWLPWILLSLFRDKRFPSEQSFCLSMSLTIMHNRRLLATELPFLSPRSLSNLGSVYRNLFSLYFNRTVSYICTVPPLSDSLPCRPQSTANSQRLPASLKHLSFRLDHQGFALYNSRPNETRNCLCYPSGFHHVQKYRQAPESSRSDPCSL